MSATKVMGIAILTAVIGRWANGKKALPSAGGVLQVTGALILISLLDTGRSAPVAKGFSWLFFAAVMLSPDSPLTGLANAEGRVPNASGAPGTGGAPAGALDKPTTRNPTARTQ